MITSGIIIYITFTAFQTAYIMAKRKKASLYREDTNKPYANETFTTESADKVTAWLESKGLIVTRRIARGKRLGAEKLYWIYTSEG